MIDGHPRDPVPVLLVAGALGAGKTTLINNILQADHGRALAAVVNDFGSINIDEAILSLTGQPIYGLKNGCICCSLQGDLLRTLRAILSLNTTPDGIVIEASGISDPRGIMEALFDPVLRDAVRLDAVVTVVDAEDHDPADELWIAQLRSADFVVLSKTASADQNNLASLRAMLGSLHKKLVFSADENGGVPIDLLLEAGSQHRETRGLGSLPPIRDDRFVRLEWTCPAPISLQRFQFAIQSLAPQLARAKGFLSLADRPGQGYLFQLVGQRASLSSVLKPVAATQLVFIGRVGIFDAGRAKAVLETMRQEP